MQIQIQWYYTTIIQFIWFSLRMYQERMEEWMKELKLLEKRQHPKYRRGVAASVKTYEEK